MQWALLKAEVLLPAYNGMTDTQTAASINSKTYQINQDIDASKAIDALLFTAMGDWGTIVGVADGVINNSAQRVRAISVRELFRRTGVFQATNDAYWTQLMVVVDALIAAATPVMSGEGKTNLSALRLKTLPLWQKFESRPIEWSDVQAARVFVP